MYSWIQSQVRAPTSLSPSLALYPSNPTLPPSLLLSFTGCLSDPSQRAALEELLEAKTVLKAREGVMPGITFPVPAYVLFAPLAPLAPPPVVVVVEGEGKGGREKMKKKKERYDDEEQSEEDDEEGGREGGNGRRRRRGRRKRGMTTRINRRRRMRRRRRSGGG